MITSRSALERTLACPCLVAVAVLAGACPSNDIPACPGRCFEFTVQHEVPTKCLTMGGGDIDIPFNGSDPDGYHGRSCFNSASVPDVLDAIAHLRAGGQLSELSLAAQDAYVGAVEAVQADVLVECMTAAPGQCMNAMQVCTGIAADLYEQLVIEQTCVLEPAGVVRISLMPGDVCHSVADPATSSAGSGDDCTDTATHGTEGLDDTATTDPSADDTTAAT